MSLREHAERSHIAPDVFCMFLGAVGCVPVYRVIRRRGKVYHLWADKRTNRKIVSCAQLETMTLPTFVEWLRERYHYARILFPDSRVFV